MIERLKNKEVYNPIRDHISIGFQSVPNIDEMMTAISQDLKTRNFNPEKSRGLIFVPTRAKAEEITGLLRVKMEDDHLPFANRIDYYHAGLDGIEREEKYDQFNSGDTLFLVATKAFGMGMDIKNIHFIYHVGPSSTFEDYLQEVGRAGRHKKMLNDAGFSDENPIITTCFVLPEDFKKLKDKLHDSQITWNQLDKTKGEVFKYIKQFQVLKPDEEKAFALPFDLLEQSDEFEDVYSVDTFFRIALYWLEKLKRIRLGVFTPTHLPIRLLEHKELNNTSYNLADRQLINVLINGLKNYQKKKFPDSELIMVEMNKMNEFVSSSSSTNILQLLYKAQKSKLLIIEREINLVPTKTRTPELKEWNPITKSLIIEATFDLAFKFLTHSTLGDQKNFDGEFIETLIKEVCAEHFKPEKIFWRATKGKNDKELSPSEIAENEQTDFVKKRTKFAFKLIGFLPKIRHKTTIEIIPDSNHPKITQLIYNGYKNHNEWKQLLESFKKDLYNLIRIISANYIQKGTEKFNIADLVIQLGIIENENDYFQQLFFISKALAYLKGSGGMIPMGVELFVQDLSPFTEKDMASHDYKVHAEFNESNQMRELRLLTLECLSKIPPNQFDLYIKEYFRSASIKDIINLLEDKLGEDNSYLRAFRSEALQKAKERLSEEQLMVYEAPLSSNLQIIAGPGSGKTHTLTLRVARLIQDEKVKPDTILVLAYNRAVVVELKERLGILFRELGYGKLINRLKVFTFHGFCRFCLSEELNDLEFEKWTSTFIRKAKNEPGIINQRLGNIKYVFVDEFQDITTERMELLKLIAPPEKSNICVIGDPNQSIYGYERANVGDPMDPKPYYDQFLNVYNPEVYYLSNNYRSYPDILLEAEKLLEKNSSKFPMPQLKAIKKPDTFEDYCQITNYGESHIKWSEKAIEIIKAKDKNGKKKYRQLAIMFRSNNEVFRAYNILKNENLENVRIRIQGGNASPFRTREFYHLICSLETKSSQIIELDYLLQFEMLKQTTISKYQNWDEYLLNLFHCIVVEYDEVKEEDSTYADLIDFIREIAYKDDGQFGKIYQKNIQKINPDLKEQEIIITTMHKVKGIEFEAVIIPPSFSNLPLKEKPENDLAEYLEEERRLYYVAYTRSKHKLLVIKDKREISLDSGTQYEFSDEIIAKLGKKLPEGIDKLNISWGACDYGSSSFEFIENKAKIGDEVKIRKQNKGGFEFGNVYVGEFQVGQMTKKAVDKLGDCSTLSGLNISSIERYTYDETIEYDIKHKTSYAIKWNELSKKRGYIYLIDFSGYGKVN